MEGQLLVQIIREVELDCSQRGYQAQLLDYLQAYDEYAGKKVNISLKWEKRKALCRDS